MTDDFTPDPQRWRALAVCLVAGFMTLLDVSIVNVALPSIRDGLGASQSDLQWIVSGYALTFGLALVPSGRLGDVRGRRTMFIVGLAAFTIVSLVAGFAPNSGWLVALRLLQGVAGGILTPQVSGIIQQLFRGAERGKAFGLFGATIGVSTAVGPLLGGVLIQLFGTEHGWRAVFFVNVPIGIVALVLAARLIPQTERRPRGEGIDPLGVVLLGAAVVTLLLPMVQQQAWKGHQKWWLVVVSVVLFVMFVLWERRYARTGQRVGVVDLRLFQRESYASSTLIGLLYFSGFTGIFFVLTLFFQNGLGYTALQAGLASTPFAIGSVLSAPIAGRMVTRIGRPLVVVGIAVVAVGLVLVDVVLSTVDSQQGWWTALPLFIGGVGSGLAIVPNVTLALQDVPVREASTASGVLQTGQRIGSAIGIAAIGSVFFSQLASTRGDYERAASVGLRVTVGLVIVALIVGLVDLWVSSRRTPQGAHASTGSEDTEPASAPGRPG